MEICVEIEGAPISSGKAAEFSYLWAKHVTGFNCANHCANCLRGAWERTICRTIVDGQYPIRMRGEFFYICGVAREWKNNLHLVVKYDPGSVARVDAFNGVRFTIHDAKRIMIDPLPLGWKGLDRSFTACRNFQFGVQEYGYDTEPLQKAMF